MPEYGAERTGAPLAAYTRVSDEPIEVHNNIVTPDYVVVLDDTLLPTIDVLTGLREGGIVLLNTKMNAAHAREALKAPAGVKVASVDASGIALDTIKRDIPNTPMVAALAAVTGVVPVEALKEQIIEEFGKKFTKEVIDANIASVDRAVEEVKVA
jgi:pyruvate ferredoxin oxidoreductase gamma subunit